MGEYQTIPTKRGGRHRRLTLRAPGAPERDDQRDGGRDVRRARARGPGPALRVLVLTGAGKGSCPAPTWSTSAGGRPTRRHARSAPHPACRMLLHEMPAGDDRRRERRLRGRGAGLGVRLRPPLRRALGELLDRVPKVAVAGDMALPWSLPRLVGAAKARELSFLCEKFSARRPRASAWSRASSTTPRFAPRSTRSPRGSRARRRSRCARSRPTTWRRRSSDSTSFSGSSPAHLEIARSADTAEAFRAFVEKREPVFRS